MTSVNRTNSGQHVHKGLPCSKQSSMLTTVFSAYNSLECSSESCSEHFSMLIIYCHNSLSYIQHSSMCSTFFHVHNSLLQLFFSCSKQSTMFTKVYHVLNILSCSQHFSMITTLFHNNLQ